MIEVGILCVRLFHLYLYDKFRFPRIYISTKGNNPCSVLIKIPEPMKFNFLKKKQNKAAKLENTSPNSKPPSLVGREGITLTKIRQTGYISIDEERYECLSEFFCLSKGSKAKVVGQEGLRLLIEPL